MPSRSKTIAVSAVLDDHLGRGVERALDHGHLEVAALSGRRPLGQADQEGKGRMHPGVGVTRSPLDAGLVERMTGDPGQPADLLHGLRETGVVPPGTVQAEGGHAHQQATGVELVDDLPRQAEVVHDPGGEVFEDGIALLDQPVQQCDTRRGTQIEGQASLVGVRTQVVRAPLPPRSVGTEDAAGHAHPVGASRRFDVDDLGAEGGEHPGRDRAGPPGREIEDAHAFEREATRALLDLGPRRPAVLDGAGVLAQYGAPGGAVADPPRSSATGGGAS